MTALDHRTSHSYAADKQKLLARLNRIQGQARGITRMVEEDRYCADILQQIAALKSAADAVGLLLLKDHLKGCVAEAVRNGDGESHIAEVIDVVGRFVRTSA